MGSEALKSRPRSNVNQPARRSQRQGLTHVEFALPLLHRLEPAFELALGRVLLPTLLGHLLLKLGLVDSHGRPDGENLGPGVLEKRTEGLGLSRKAVTLLGDVCFKSAEVREYGSELSEWQKGRRERQLTVGREPGLAKSTLGIILEGTIEVSRD